MKTKLETMVTAAVLSALGLDEGEGASPEGTPNAPFEKGQAVIVRSRDAGVVFGEYESNDGDTVHVTNARQMWKWTAAKGGTLLDCGQHGVSSGKFSNTNDRVTILNACAIIHCTEKAAKSIRGINVDFS